MWNPFKKNQQQTNVQLPQDDGELVSLDKNGEDVPKMNMLQRLAMKKIEKMSSQEKMKMAAEAFKPENRGKMLKVMEMMRKTGQISEEQYRTAKEQMEKM